MNLFDKQLLTDTFQTFTQSIVMNPNSNESYTIDVFITNTTFNKDSSYHVHSLNEFRQGDTFQINNKYYLVTSDVVCQRGIKYKGIADYCNITIPIYETVQIETGVDDFGRPIYSEIQQLTGYNYGVISHRSMTQEGSDLIVVNTELILTIRDNQLNRDTYVINHEITFEDKNWKVVERDFTNKGIIKCRLTSTT